MTILEHKPLSTTRKISLLPFAGATPQASILETRGPAQELLTINLLLYFNLAYCVGGETHYGGWGWIISPVSNLLPIVPAPSPISGNHQLELD